MSPIEVAIFISRVESICAEMGAILQRAAFSPNIKDRLDFSCALFDAEGKLFAQAAHIPVHLGSMAYAMADIVEAQDWQADDMLVLNDPFLGGTHLPDVTAVAPLFTGAGQKPICFVVNRAHHANIGATAPGSMPLSRTLAEEGMIIAPTMFIKQGQLDQGLFDDIVDLPGADTSGDFAAQISANRTGIKRLQDLISELGVAPFNLGIDAVNAYGERIAHSVLQEIPAGRYHFSDVMDDNGYGLSNIPITIVLEITNTTFSVDFTGTSGQVEGNINCPISVAAAAVFYVFRCLLPHRAPNCAGIFKAISLTANPGSLIDAQRPAATAAGNVETSMRIVDIVLGALAQAIPARIPAASQGTMNNVAMGNHSGNMPWDYYETIAGGMGASAKVDGLSGVQCHMTNTLNTPIESLESHYPIRVLTYAIRSNSGGMGACQGGDGLIREFEFLDTTQLTLLTERRIHAPWGLKAGRDGALGINRLDGKTLPGKCFRQLRAGQVLRIETPGGGGYGARKKAL